MDPNILCVEPSVAAFAGFISKGSSNFITATAALSINEISCGKASLKKPETLKVTSTRGRSKIDKGNISKPVTLLFAKSQVGLTPISAIAWAISSPPVRILAVPQAVINNDFGQSPLFCKCFSKSKFADFQPKAQAVGVGTARLSTLKKFRPVGRTSNLPRVGAPDEPGSIKLPFKELRTPKCSLLPQDLKTGLTVSFICFITKSEFLPLKLIIPSINLDAKISRRSTVSP